ncbi:hypothetical protein Pla110_43160 [Polystyrenella longa]|uniref:Potassium channel domain-containing protein n=1 Tax=Polystyrenella longa TaxID=2528007 RepID=A0A518CTL4_9PLAN|nr:ion channel [Polystyrenella longa]QDU82558.1 hypothetical protein Pla110_43160 [Polystyrenella longa]
MTTTSSTNPSRYSAFQFLICFVLFLCVSPVFDSFPQGHLIETVLLTLVLISAIPAIGGDSRTLMTASLLATPVLVGKWLHHLFPDTVPMIPFLLSGIIFATFIVIHHLKFVLRAREVDTHVLSAGISTFLLIGLLWGFCYLLLDNIYPNSFSIEANLHPTHQLTGFVAIYFSLGTLSGLGMNDVAPASNFAKMLSLLESMVSVFYLAILISRLVSMHMERAAADE